MTGMRRLSVGDRVLVDAGDDWGRPWGEVIDQLSGERVLVRFTSGAKIIVPESICRARSDR